MTRLTAVPAGTGRGPRLLFGLAGAAALAAHAWPVTLPPPPAPPPGAAVAPAGEAALRRPLFDPGRRPWTGRGSREAVLEGDPPRPILMLRGLRRDGATARALIDDGSGDRGWLGQGEGRDGWLLAEIGPDSVTLVRDGQSYTTAFMGPPAILRPKRRAGPGAASEAGPTLRP